MRPISCDRCGSPRYHLIDNEDGTVSAKCDVCEKIIKFKKVEEKET